MSYLLDTNACIALINTRPTAVRQRFAAAARAGEVLATSTIVLYELWYGAAKSQDPVQSGRKVQAFLSGPVEVVPFDEEDARRAGDVRARAERAGKPLGAYDLLIAGQALRLDATLITANQREFARVPGLRCEDWSKPS